MLFHITDCINTILGQNPPGQNLAKSKMAFILNSDGFKALLLINMLSRKLYVYIQLQMRYLIASGST